MKLLAEPRVTIKKSFKIFMRYSKLIKLTTYLERISKLIGVPASNTQTGRQLRAVVLHGPRHLKLECIHEEAIQPTQVRVDVRFCGLTGSDVLLWRGEHRRTTEPRMVLGFQLSGTILQMGGLAHERTGYQIGEQVVAHNYPACGGLAESCLVHYKDVFRLMGRVSLESAAAAMDDYFSALLALGRRARIRRDESFLVNAKHSQAALPIIDLAVGVFRAKPIAVCDNARRAELCAELGATVICNGNERSLPHELKEMNGKEEIRVIMDTEGGPGFRNIIKCLEQDGLIALLGYARDRRRPNFCFLSSSNCTVFAVAAEHYKIADTLVYRESMQHLLDYHSRCVIRPRISAVFGLHRINEAFNYYTTVASGHVLIDMKNCNRLTLCDE